MTKNKAKKLIELKIQKAELEKQIKSLETEFKELGEYDENGIKVFKASGMTKVDWQTIATNIADKTGTNLNLYVKRHTTVGKDTTKIKVSVKG